ncbi:hypothetical protein [Variovorax sp. JS1663]|uniref:hypothetical protein n=1 Tax=Variovorax sp. JS1663 TaxID=1851577 RepID=UPI000B34379A|nr:hypothetical protein [Variovorax sp. JS1663]OUL98599.1 hypothetical protein A8M77_30685 [Variovorax sp. JS1663]
MNTTATARYAKVIEISKRMRWEIDRDIVRGRDFDYGRAFLPDGLSLADELDFLDAADRRLLSQVQGRTYAYMFGLAERFISAKIMEIGHARAFGDQVEMEALVRMTDEELKHQALFRRLEDMMAAGMPPGHRMTAEPNAVAQVVLASSTWAVLALTLHIERFSQAHYRASIGPDEQLCPLWKDVFLYHWREEAQHAVLDEMEFLREDEHLDAAARDAAVDDLIALVGAFDAILQGQAAADAAYFCAIAGTQPDALRRRRIEGVILKAYRWQYLVSGFMEPRFRKILFSCLDDAQAVRIRNAMAPLAYAVPRLGGLVDAIAA